MSKKERLNKSCGWLSPVGNYFDVFEHKIQHQELAQMLVSALFREEKPENGTKCQHILMDNGWIRLDIKRHLMSKELAPTNSQLLRLLELEEGVKTEIHFL